MAASESRANLTTARARLGHRLAGLGFVAVLSAAFGARAQQGPEIPPPTPYAATDANGVNLASGAYTATTTPIAIGQPDQGGLAFSASFDTSVNEWRNSIAGMVARQPFIGPDADHPWYTVTVMGSSTVFLEEAGAFVPLEGYGSLVESGGVLTYTAPDGTIAVFGGGSTYSPFVANEGLISKLTRPNGEVTTFTYTTVTMTNGFPARRIQSVNTNLGYQLHFEYGSNSWGADWYRMTKVVALNNGVDYCAPTANTCTFNEVWPSLTFTQTATERTVVDALGRTTRLLSPNGWLSGVRRPSRSSGQSITRTRDMLGSKTASISDGVGTWEYDYGSTPPPPLPQTYTTTTTVTDPLNHETEAEISWYQADLITAQRTNRVTAVTNPLGQTTEYLYNAHFELGRINHPEGNSDVWVYTDRGAIASRQRIAKPGSGLATTTVTATYPATCTNPVTCNRPTAVEDARGNVTDYTWNTTHGGLLTATRPAPTAGAVRPQTRYTYAALKAWYRTGTPTTQVQSPTAVYRPTISSACAATATCAGAATEVKTTTAYQAGSAGAFSNLLPVTVTAGSGDGVLAAATTTVWEPTGDPLTIKGPMGAADVTRYVYDAMRQPLGVIGPDPDGAGARLFPAVKTSYNADGQPTSVQRGTTTAQTDPAWAAFTPRTTDTTIYDAQGRKTRDLTASGTAAAMLSQYSYDAAGNLTCSTVRMNPATFASPPASACTLATEGTFGKDRITRNTYDAADRVLTTTSGYLVTGAITESQTWTANGQVATRTDGRGNVSTWLYDGFDRISRLRFPNPTGGGSSTTDYENTTYDAADNVTAFRNRAGQTIATTYDALNRKTLLNPPTGTADVTYAYDNLDRMLTATAGTLSVTRTWDALSRMTVETGRLGTYGFQYDLAGRRTRITWPDAFYAQYTWDLSNSVTLIGQNGATSGVGVLAAYSYDNLGRRTGTTRGNGVSSSSAWNAADRLTSLAHNLAGSAQDVTFGFTYNPAAQIVTRSSSNSAYTYVPATGTTAYVNNGKNQMTSVGGVAATYDANGNILSDGQDHFTYDALNRLTHTDGRHYAYDPLGQLTAMGTRELSVVDGRPAAVHTSDGTVTNRFVPGPRTSEYVGYSDGAGAGTPYWLLTDERASAIAYAAADGTAAIKTYDEYGVATAGQSGYIRYAGLFTYSIPEGLYYAQARFYAPRHGRFLQPDPIGYEAGLNLYAYVTNDPVNRVDPTGMIWQQAMQNQEGRQEPHPSMRGDGRSIWQQIGDTFRTDPVGATITTVGVIMDVADSALSPGPDATLVAAGVNGIRVSNSRSR